MTPLQLLWITFDRRTFETCFLSDDRKRWPVPWPSLPDRGVSRSAEAGPGRLRRPGRPAANPGANSGPSEVVGWLGLSQGDGAGTNSACPTTRESPDTPPPPHPPANAWFCRDGARSATRAAGPVGGSNLALGGGHRGRPRGLRGPSGCRRPLPGSHLGAASWRHRTYKTLMLLILPSTPNTRQSRSAQGCHRDLPRGFFVSLVRSAVGAGGSGMTWFRNVCLGASTPW